SSEPQTDYFDETVTGLALRVTSHGTKAWTFLYGTPRRRITLGRYPSVSLATARALAIEAREGRTRVMTICGLPTMNLIMQGQGSRGLLNASLSVRLQGSRS